MSDSPPCRRRKRRFGRLYIDRVPELGWDGMGGRRRTRTKKNADKKGGGNVSAFIACNPKWATDKKYCHRQGYRQGGPTHSSTPQTRYMRDGRFPLVYGLLAQLMSRVLPVVCFINERLEVRGTPREALKYTRVEHPHTPISKGSGKQSQHGFIQSRVGPVADTSRMQNPVIVLRKERQEHLHPTETVQSIAYVPRHALPCTR